MRKLLGLVLLVALLAGCQHTQVLQAPPAWLSAGIQRAGFDIDDTLLFSTPAFAAASAKYAFGTDTFWAEVNGHDRDYSRVKRSALEVVRALQTQGVTVYAITARPPTGGEAVGRFLQDAMGIPAENVYFEPRSKQERIRALRLDVFYGDSDSDISDAQAVGVTGIRFLRSPASSYRNSDGTLAKYHPGQFGEIIIPASED
ncbi:MAG TPA: HAD family acid phosphatase [bacterium]|nr:HAD family acid phosphatase [bacterium]